jgi:hypothetical protein
VFQLDEDVRVLLQRLDAETADETEIKSEFGHRVLRLAMCITVCSFNKLALVNQCY